MAKIILSIKPKFAEKILAQKKSFEFRTKIPQKQVESILIYETAPFKKIVAEVKIVKIISGSPSEIWRQTKNKAGISKKAFNKYFKGHTIAYAYHLGQITVYTPPLTLENFGLSYPPQSFVYIQA